MIQGRSLKLTKKEFVIFKKLYHSSLLENHPLLSRENLLDEEWKKQTVTPRTVDVHIVGLRKKLKPFQIEINAKRGEGYWLKIPDFLKDG